MLGLLLPNPNTKLCISVRSNPTLRCLGLGLGLGLGFRVRIRAKFRFVFLSFLKHCVILYLLGNNSVGDSMAITR